MAVCFRQIVPDRWSSIRKKIFLQMFLCLHGGGVGGGRGGGVTKVCVTDAYHNCLAGV